MLHPFVHFIVFCLLLDRLVVKFVEYSLVTILWYAQHQQPVQVQYLGCFCLLDHMIDVLYLLLLNVEQLLMMSLVKVWIEISEVCDVQVQIYLLFYHQLVYLRFDVLGKDIQNIGVSFFLMEYEQIWNLQRS